MPDQDLSDPVIDEIREIRSRISARFDHDTKKLIDHYMELQERYKERLIGNSKQSAPEDEAAA
jgi:hypothetical protein